MRKIKIQNLTNDNFRKYGSFVSMIDPPGSKGSGRPVSFTPDMVVFNAQSEPAISYSTCRVEPRPMLINAIEYHDHTGEANMPIDGDCILYFAPPSRKGASPLDSFEAFYIPQGTMVIVRPGVWHCAPFATGDKPVNVMVVLPERTYAIDCTFQSLQGDDQIEIVK